MAQIHEQVAAAVQSSRTSATFTPGRYPRTYAYDFFRSHPSHFGEATYGFSRAIASGLVREYAERTGQPLREVLVALADGYLAESGVEASDEQKAEALARAFGDEG